MRKKDEHTRTQLLDCAREIANEKGIASISMRRLAAKAGVATGTVYNYFSDKDDVLLALTEEDWSDALETLRSVDCTKRFSKRLEETYAFLHGYIRTSAGGLMNALTNARNAGCKRMEAMQSSLKDVILEQLRQDDGIKDGVWSETFTREQFAEFMLNSLVFLLKSDAQDAGFLAAIVERILY